MLVSFQRKRMTRLWETYPDVQISLILHAEITIDFAVCALSLLVGVACEVKDGNVNIPYQFIVHHF